MQTPEADPTLTPAMEADVLEPFPGVAPGSVETQPGVSIDTSDGLQLSDPKRKKRPQSVLVVICTRGGEFLVMRRARPADFWQSVTGSLAPGESPRLAAAREVMEETGLRVGGALIDLHQSVLFPIIRAWRERYAPNVCFNREYWFALVLDSRRRVQLDPGEHLEYRWLPAAAAAALTGSWSNRDAIGLVASQGLVRSFG